MEKENNKDEWKRRELKKCYDLEKEKNINSFAIFGINKYKESLLIDAMRT